MKTQKHTPGPWHVRGRLIEAPTKTVAALSKVTDCDAFRAESQANAEFIVRACNAHDGLVQELRNCLEIIEKDGIFREAICRARAALAKLE